MSWIEGETPRCIRSNYLRYKSSQAVSHRMPELLTSSEQQCTMAFLKKGKLQTVYMAPRMIHDGLALQSADVQELLVESVRVRPSFFAQSSDQ